MALRPSRRHACRIALACCLTGAAVGCGTVRNLITVKVPVAYPIPCPVFVVPQQPTAPPTLPNETLDQTLTRLRDTVVILAAYIDVMRGTAEATNTNASELRKAFEAALQSPPKQ